MLDHVIRLYTIEFWYRLLYQMINSLASSTILQFHISNSLYLINKWIHFSKFLCGMLLLFHCACVPFLSTGPLKRSAWRWPLCSWKRPDGLYAAENDQMTEWRATDRSTGRMTRLLGGVAMATGEKHLPMTARPARSQGAAKSSSSRAATTWVRLSGKKCGHVTKPGHRINVQLPQPQWQQNWKWHN